MRIEYSAPSPALAAWIAAYYLFESDAAVVEGITRADINQMWFLLEGSGEIGFPGGPAVSFGPLTVTAAGSAAGHYRMQGPVRCFGMRVKPAGWGALVRRPAKADADRASDGVPLMGARAAQLHAGLVPLATLDEMIALAEPMLLAIGRDIPARHAAVIEAIEHWLAGDAPTAEGLYEAVELSPRHLARLSNRYFGGPPKLLERRARALAAAARLLDGADPAEVAAAFYDQSHMIREVRHFSGHTPGSLAAAENPMLALALARFEAPEPREAS